MIPLRYLIFFFIFCFVSCISNNEKINKNENSIKNYKNASISIRDSIKDSKYLDSLFNSDNIKFNIKSTDNLLTKWIKRNVGCRNVKVDLLKSKFIDSLYNINSNLTFDKELPPILSIEEDSIRNTYPSFKYSFKQVSFSIRGETVSYHFFILEDKFIISKDYMLYSESTIFDLRTKSVQNFEFGIINVKNGKAQIISRGREENNLKMNFRDGIYNIYSGKTKWGI